MTLLPEHTGIDWHPAYVSERHGPEEGLASDISYSFATFGDAGRGVTIQGVPATRSAREVDIRALPVGCPVIIVQVKGEDATIWPIGIEEIIFEDCPPESPERVTLGTKFRSFLRGLVGG